MRKNKVGAIAIKSFALLVVLGTAHLAKAQEARTTDPSMAPVEQYLGDRHAEISLARSVAPDAISPDAPVIVRTRHGYESAAEGKNGWVCWVGRAWMAMFDHREFWNSKVRTADCLNPPAARSFLAYFCKRTELALSGHSKQEAMAQSKPAASKKELTPLEQGTVSCMMSLPSYRTDDGSHSAPHVMFFPTEISGTAWGASRTNSPVLAEKDWHLSAEAYRQFSPGTRRVK